MSLRIRLSRGGAKKRPYYRVVVADSRRARDGRFIERIGSLNPMVPKDHPERFTIDEERVKYWLGVGATPTDRLARYLGNMGLVAERKVPEQTKKHLPKSKAQEREAEKAEKAQAAKEAAAEAAAAPAGEAPAEEAPAEEAAAAEVAVEAAAADEAPAEEVAAEEAPAEEVAAEEAPAEDEKKKEDA